MNLCDTEVEERADGEFDNFDDAEDVEDIAVSKEVVTKEATELAKSWIVKFFCGTEPPKEMHYGGPIPEGIIVNDKNVMMLLNVDMSTAVITTYAAMEVHNGSPYPIAMGGISDDVRWTLAFIRNCANMRVPDCFVGGLMLIYLEVCEGIKIPKELDVRNRC